MTLLEIENLAKELGGLVATDDMNLTVEGDERISITGPNGAGRSAPTDPITRQLDPTSDGIHFKGKSIVDLEPHQVVRRGVSKSFQAASVFPDLAVEENTEIAVLAVEHGAFGFEFLRHRDSLTDVHDVARDMLDSVGLLGHADTIAAGLPYGDKRRPEIDIALANEPGLLPMDEPTADMSPEETKSTVDLIEQVKRDHGLTFILVEHDMEIVFSISDRVVILSCGGIIAKGTPDEIRGNEVVQEAYFGGVEL